MGLVVAREEIVVSLDACTQQPVMHIISVDLLGIEHFLDYLANNVAI